MFTMTNVQPLPKQRPRINGRRAYTPPRTKAYETQVAWDARIAMQGREPLTGNVKVTLAFARKGKKRADIDNLEKAVMDAMNGIVFEDDQQVVEMHATVHYGAKVPGVHVTVERVND
jgi:Holliday junction resolvase RusA-like endonuclease